MHKAGKRMIANFCYNGWVIPTVGVGVAQIKYGMSRNLHTIPHIGGVGKFLQVRIGGIFDFCLHSNN